MVMQCMGAICGAGVVKGFEGKGEYNVRGGGANVIAHGYTKGDGLRAEIVGTFVFVYTVFSATDAKCSARDSHVPGTEMQLGLAIESKNATLSVKRRLACEQLSYLRQAAEGLCSYLLDS